MPFLLRPLLRLPAHVLNGITVALGIGLHHLLFTLLAGPHVAQLALSGAIYASLADLPGTLARSWRRMAVAAGLGCLTALTVALLRPYPLLLGASIAILVFAAMMTLAWGPRAGPVSFAVVLSIVFTMGLPAGQPVPELLGWHVAGALVYMGWSFGVLALLQRRYRSLALAAALGATADLLRARADLLEDSAAEAVREGRLQAWIGVEARLAERLQVARDILFASPDTALARGQAGMLLRAIDLRDILLAGRLDLDLLGTDTAASQVRGVLAGQLRELAQALQFSQAGLRGGPLPPGAAEPPLPAPDLFAGTTLAPGDPRARLLPALADRGRHLHNDVARIAALLRGALPALPLSREELRLFVAPEGWPLAALRAQLSMASPVLRHALRAGLALGSAYFLALLLPWASHPQWMVLSVAVVLRGNLEQTLSRRNVRVLGTLLGCLLVLLLARVPSTEALMLVFIIAVGLAHGFALERYLVTAVAATVMALLQAHLVDPASGFPIAERLADTLIGALLAWAFSYVLPSWERRSLPRAIARALLALQDYAQRALRIDPEATVAQRLARRQAYDALGALAGALQRSAVEPARVRPPVRELSALLDHGQRLMAHLSMVRLMLTHRGTELDQAQTMAALAATEAALCASLAPPGKPGTPPAALPGLDTQGLELLPTESPTEELQPWMLRRLHATAHDGREVAHAARAALARLAATKGAAP